MFSAGLMLGQRPTYQLYINVSRSTPWVLTSEAPQVATGIPVLVYLTVQAGVEVQSNSAASPAVSLAGLASGSDVVLTNNGYVLGRGGAGGNGGSFSGSFGPTPGQQGGTALLGPGIGCRLTIANGSGRLWAGGGGGGGGGYNLVYVGSPVFAYQTEDGGGGGGGGAGVGAAGTGYGGALAATAGTSGALGAAGSGGTTLAAGTSGDGGVGASYGNIGTAGSAGIYYGGGPTDGNTIFSGAPGGAQGYAVNADGATLTWLSTGDVRGVVA